MLVPTLLRAIMIYLSFREDKSTHPLRALRLFVCSGETLSVQLSVEFFDHFPEGQHVLANFYGSTEVMGDVTYFVCESKKQLSELQKIPIGYPVDNTVIYIVDKDMQPVKMGEIGEMYVSGLNLAAGYVNKRDPDRFVENPLAFDQSEFRFLLFPLLTTLLTVLSSPPPQPSPVQSTIACTRRETLPPSRSRPSSTKAERTHKSRSAAIAWT